MATQPAEGEVGAGSCGAHAWSRDPSSSCLGDPVETQVPGSGEQVDDPIRGPFWIGLL